jgi:amino acid adenylation domain-containing protein
MHLNHRQAIFAPAVGRAGGRRLKIAHTVSFSFDMSWEELLWLIEGHEVHICDEVLRRDATALVAYCHEHQIDVINVTPTYAALLFEEGLLDADGHPPVLVLLGGEAVSAAVWDRLRDGRGWYGYNLYGPTEYTINTLGGGTDDSVTPTVGQPIWNTRAHILDSWLRPVPDGIPGELYIAGAGLARGYLRQPALSAHRFVANPFEPGRMYRTGDLVIRRADGNIEFLGRTDDQVKIRGYRVELGDVEAAIAAHPGVSQAAVIARPDETTSGSHRLVGYVVTAAGQSTDLVDELRSHLRATLPPYMVPTAIAVLDALPLTDNGKLDVRALPDMAGNHGQPPSRPPQSEAEQTLCELFAEVLGVDEVGVEDDFFDLGGHSLLTIKLINRVRSTLGHELTLGDIFNDRTAAALAERFDSGPAQASPPRPRLTTRTRPDPIPTAPAQQRLLTLERLGETGTAYNYPLVFRVRGALDTDALHGAVTDVVARHESLRTVFDEHDGGYFQRILPAGTRPPMEVVDCGDAHLAERVADAADNRFDLAAQIPVRVTVFRTAPDDHTVVLLLHHIATDEWSDAPLLADLNAAYRSRTSAAGDRLDPLPVQYADYTLWQRELLEGIGEQQLEFWRAALAEAPDEMTLPVDRARPARPTGAGGTLHIELPTETATALRALAAERQVSMLMALHAAVALLLHRLGAGDDIVVGTAVAGRDEAALNEVVGFFVNTVVLRADVSGNPSFDDLLSRVRSADLAAFAHQELPFERVVEDVNPPRAAGRNPLFNVFIGYQLRGDDDAMFGLHTEWGEPPVTAAMFDLALTLIDERAGRVTLIADFSADLFDESTVRTLTRRLIAVLDRVATEPATRAGAVDLLGDDEREALIALRNDTWFDVEPDSLATLVSRQATRTPHATAVLHDRVELSYAELDRWSDRLAARLIDDGVRPRAIVGVALPRSIELVVALLAVTKTGAAFLPLDPEYPPDRLAYMIADARPATVIDDVSAVREADNPVHDAPLPDVDPAGWAYVLYTSGSTGKPKGVAVPHAGVVNRIAWLQHAYPLTTGDRVLVKTPTSFDTSVWEVFLSLSAGATLVMARPGGHREPGYLAETIVSQRVTTVDFVPSMLELFLDEPRSAQCTSLSRVTVGGEALSTELANRFTAALPVPLHNLYGPTEASVDVLGWTADGGPVALGVPGWNVQAYVLDTYLNPAPAGASGELYLAGVQLADGYLHRHGLTAQRFVANPFGDGDRMYRTGDVVRWRGDGQLEYLGRSDDQIKLRGVRIEPGEIETVLAGHSSVSSARVDVRADRLIAYYLPAGEADGSASESLRAHATAALPIHMIPSTYVELTAFPLTPSGKLDRNALPAPEIDAETGRPAGTERQRRLCAIFTDVLGVDVTTIDADFFSLGGHSLLGIRLINAVRAALSVEISIRDVFDSPTVALLDARLASGSTRVLVSRPDLGTMPRPPRIPASPAQERLLILDRIGETGTAYNYSLVFRVRGSLKLDALRGALTDVVNRHESLRTTFDEDDDGYFQTIWPAGTEVPIQVCDCAQAARPRLIAEAVQYRFELGSQIPLRVDVLRVGPDDHTVVVLLHHIATDEWSDAPFIADLNSAYRSRVTGSDAALPVLPVQYADYTLWQRDLLASVGQQQLQFWRSALADAPDEMALAVDRPRPPRPTGAGGALHVEVPSETVAALRVLAGERQASMLMLLHAAVAVLLHRFGAGDDIVVGTPVAGRDEAALNEVIGFFVNTVVLRTELSGNPSIGDLLTRVRTADLAAFAHQELPFERLVEDLNPPRIAGRNPLFNVFIGYHLGDGVDAEMFGLDTEWEVAPVSTSMFDIGFTLIDEQRATVLAEFSSDLFDEPTVRRLTRRLVTVLGELVADAGTRIGDIELLDHDEHDALIRETNDTARDVEPISLATLISRQAEQTPESAAVVFGGSRLSYAELADWSDRLAGELISDGVGPGSIVGVSLPRSVELVAALLAVAKSGAAFLPLDPDYPPDRLVYMIDDARPTVVLDDPAVVRVARTAECSQILPDIDPAGWAYVLYTSGSTGRPKGVAVPHAGIVNRIGWLQNAYPLTAGDRMLVKTPISFDTSVWEVFWPLSAGATLVVAQPGGHRDPRYLAETIASYGVTAVDFVPSMLELFLDEPLSAQCSSLTRVTVGGEALSNELAKRFTAALDVPLHNLYGPTEASVDVLGWTSDGGPVALGAPGWNVRAYVLDPYLKPVPVGAPGELYLAGVQLADGYLHRPSLTAMSFVTDPFESGSRMYRTGDLVRRRDDSQLEYLGRIDEQIKLRGVRIEPGEVETVLGDHPAVGSARVVVRGDRLVAYYVPAETTRTSTAESLRTHAMAALPVHMVPSAFVALPAFPLTPSGKLDRKALPDPQTDVDAGRPPTTADQRRLCELFTDVLGIEVATIDADFFALGGHSLLLVRLAATIRRAFGVDMSVAELMVSPTVAQVADRLSDDTDAPPVDGFATLLPLRASGSAPPLFCIHPASGLSWQYVGLKRHLPQDIPLYGLQSPLFSGASLPSTIGELAGGYADTIVEAAPTGPIRLLGWSFGGAVAFLVAQELTGRGRDVGWVGMLDSYPEVVQNSNFETETVLPGLLREMGFDVEPGTAMTIADAVALMHTSDDAIAVLDDAAIAMAIENYVAAERFSIGADYGRYDGDVFFVDAMLETDSLGIASHAWRSRITGEIETITMNCGHSELMDAAVLERLGPQIAAALEK